METPYKALIEEDNKKTQALCSARNALVSARVRLRSDLDQGLVEHIDKTLDELREALQ